jgi:hypothetical protein
MATAGRTFPFTVSRRHRFVSRSSVLSSSTHHAFSPTEKGGNHRRTPKFTDARANKRLEPLPNRSSRPGYRGCSIPKRSSSSRTSDAAENSAPITCFIQASIGNKTVEEDDLSPVYAMFIISLVRKKNPYHPFHRAHLEHSNWRPGQSSYVNKYPLLRQRADLSQ